jgi:hypothetical protein
MRDIPGVENLIEAVPSLLPDTSKEDWRQKGAQLSFAANPTTLLSKWLANPVGIPLA